MKEINKTKELLTEYISLSMSLFIDISKIVLLEFCYHISLFRTKTEENATCDKTDDKTEEPNKPASKDVEMMHEKITKPHRKFVCKECGMGFDKPCHLAFHKG